jgi:hypothetical protein
VKIEGTRFQVPAGEAAGWGEVALHGEVTNGQSSLLSNQANPALVAHSRVRAPVVDELRNLLVPLAVPDYLTISSFVHAVRTPDRCATAPSSEPPQARNLAVPILWLEDELTAAIGP